MNQIKILTKQVAIYGFSTILVRILNYFLVPLHTNIFGRSEFGMVTNLYAYVAIFLIILTYGLETGFFRFINKEKNDKNIVYSTCLISLLTTTSFFLVIALLMRKTIAGLLNYADRP